MVKWLKTCLGLLFEFSPPLPSPPHSLPLGLKQSLIYRKNKKNNNNNNDYEKQECEKSELDTMSCRWTASLVEYLMSCGLNVNVMV